MCSFKLPPTFCVPGQWGFEGSGVTVGRLRVFVSVDRPDVDSLDSCTPSSRLWILDGSTPVELVKVGNLVIYLPIRPFGDSNLIKVYVIINVVMYH